MVSTPVREKTKSGGIRGNNDAPRDPSRPAVVKLSFNVAQHQVDALKRIADERGVSMTEVLRHAIALEEYLQDQTAKGQRIVVEDEKGQDRREIVLLGR
jgi:hypothetical protein